MTPVQKNPALRTGAFVAFGLVLFAVSILFFGGDRAFLTRYNTYQVKFDSTQGLATGSVISLAGVEVGNITGIDFADDGELVAQFKVNRKHAHRINENSRAVIRTQGALGDKYIYISTAPSDRPPLADGALVPSDEKADLMDVISGKAADLGVVVDVMKEMNALLHNINANDKSAKLVEGIIDASRGIQSFSTDPELRASFKYLSNILRKIDNGQGTLGEMVNNSTLHDRLMNLMGETPRNRFLKPLLREAIKQNEKPTR